MSGYRCNHCGAEFEGKLAPFACPSCQAKGKWYESLASAPQWPSKPLDTPSQPGDGGGLSRPGARPGLGRPSIRSKGAPKAPGPGTLPRRRPRKPLPRKPRAASQAHGPTRVVWTYPEQPASDALPQRNCPAWHPGEGFVVACIQNSVFAFRESRGQFDVQWQYATGGNIPGSPTVGSDGNLRVHSSDGYLHILRGSGERFCDPVQIGEPLGWASPLVDARNTTWICGSSGGLLRVDADGKKADRPYFRSREKLDCTGLIYDDALYIGGNNACVFAIPLTESRGTNRWNPLNGEGKTGWYINSAIALAGGPAFIVASRDDHLHAFDLRGAAMWSEPMPGQMLGSCVVDGNNIFVGLAVLQRGQSGSGLLVRIDATTHRISWRYEVPAPVESTPVIGNDDIVYFGDNEGTVHAVDYNGQPVWKEKVGAPVRSPGTIACQQRVLFGLDDGRFVSLLCSSETLKANGWPKFAGTLEQSGLAS